MSKRFALGALTFLIAAAAIPAQASDRDKRFFKSVQGLWKGPGEIVAGKYKGTKFTCTFKGDIPRKKVGVSLDGTCSSGIFSQKMHAKIQRHSRGYRGTFMDGAKGKGLDVVSGNVSRNKVVFGLKRKELKGAMLARLSGKNGMNITISVRVDKQMVPVIGMSLKRVDEGAVSSVSK